MRCQVLGEHMTTEVPGDTHVEEAGSGGGGDRDTQRPQLFIEVSEVRQRVCWAKLGNTEAPGAPGNRPVRREPCTRKTDPAERRWVMRVEDSRTQVGFPSFRGRKSFSRKPDPGAALSTEPPLGTVAQAPRAWEEAGGSRRDSATVWASGGTSPGGRRSSRVPRALIAADTVCLRENLGRAERRHGAPD